jgi:serine protease
MNQSFSKLIIASSLGGLLLIPTLGILSRKAIAQLSSANNLSYTFDGQEIPLTVREDVVGVAFKEGGTRAPGGSPYQQLKKDLLQAGTRGGPRVADIKPLGTRYAIVTLPTGTRGTNKGEISQRVMGLPYVQSTVAVLTRSDRKETILLPNEIVISVDGQLADPKAFQTFLSQNNLEVVRPIRFTKNRYIVRAKNASGPAILNVAKQLKAISGVKTATPNFVQSLSYAVPAQNPKQTLQPNRTLKPKPSTSVQPQGLLSSALLPMQWYIDSRPLRGEQPRTDVDAITAWNQYKATGKGAVVAVIDSLIQWDHPDLISNLAKDQTGATPLPGEKSGWDFAQNDADTRISPEELAAVTPDFQASFTLSNEELAKRYPEMININNGTIDEGSAAYLRRIIQGTIASEFHGTWSAGVIAARTRNKSGMVGVAPDAKILPVRVFGLNGAIELTGLIEAIRYSAERKVDVINMSLGGSLPSDEMAAAIDEVLKANPNLVIVASSGNDGRDGVGYPSAFPGVVSVGATNLEGYRAPYSNFGTRLDLVAPGGDTAQSPIGGMLTTGGTFVSAFWQGIQPPQKAWEPSLDPKGQYSLVQGTSFSSPTVAGIVALMRSEDRQGRLNREQFVDILKRTASYKNLSMTEQEKAALQSIQSQTGVKTSSSDAPGGDPTYSQRYLFGSGLVNAAAAVSEVEKLR